MKKKVVLLQGAFEILNAGHVRVFKECRKQGDYLIIALNTNELLKEYKGRDAVLPWEEKKEILSAIRWIDEVVPAPSFSPLELLKKYKVNVYCLSPEWKETKAVEIAHMEATKGKVFYTTDHRDIMRTRQIKKSLLEEAQAGV